MNSLLKCRMSIQHRHHKFLLLSAANDHDWSLIAHSNAFTMRHLGQVMRIKILQKLSRLSSESTGKLPLRQLPSTRRYITATAAYDQSIDTFPSIIVGPNKSIVPLGSFAEAQAQVSLSYHHLRLWLHRSLHTTGICSWAGDIRANYWYWYCLREDKTTV